MTKKGQKITEEAKMEYRKTALKTLVSKYNWKIIEPYLDIELKNGSVKRIKTFITLREFKENIENGICLVEMIRNGVSGQIIQFYSNLLQGKINLTKEKFIEEYEKGMSLNEIALKYKITKIDITYLRQFYNIKRKCGNFIKRKKTETRLTQRQIEVLYGTMMGDASKHGTSNSVIYFGHSIKQKKYLFWKFQEFKNICRKKNLKKYSRYDKRYDKTYTGWDFRTKANTDVEICIKEFYKSGKKEISNKTLEKLSPLSIAVWYSDDGTTHFYEEKKKVII